MSARPRRRRPALLVLAVLLVAAVAGGGYLLRPTTGATAGASEETAATDPPIAGDTPPPGAATPATGSASPPEPAAPTTSAAPAPSAPQPVGVALTYSGWDPSARAVVVGGGLLDRVEQGGVCTLVLSRGGVVLEGTGAATPDATTTTCGELRVSGPELTSGSWQAVVRYSSPTAAGESSATEVMVP